MRPNIIIFNPDEMRWDTMSHMGNPAAVTPFLDEFARREAVSFRNAFCQNPVCVPSRCSFFTGLYPHVVYGGDCLELTPETPEQVLVLTIKK